MQIFALKATEALGAAASAAAGVSLARHEERELEDGEFKVRALESVRGSHVLVLQSLHGDRTQSTNDKLCRLAFFVGALKDAGAGEVTAVVPYSSERCPELARKLVVLSVAPLLAQALRSLVD